METIKEIIKAIENLTKDVKELISREDALEKEIKKIDTGAIHKLTGRVDTLEREMRMRKNENMDLKKANSKMRSQIKNAQRAINETDHSLRTAIHKKS